MYEELDTPIVTSIRPYLPVSRITLPAYLRGSEQERARNDWENSVLNAEREPISFNVRNILNRVRDGKVRVSNPTGLTVETSWDGYNEPTVYTNRNGIIKNDSKVFAKARKRSTPNDKKKEGLGLIGKNNYEIIELNENTPDEYFRDYDLELSAGRKEMLPNEYNFVEKIPQGYQIVRNNGRFFAVTPKGNIDITNKLKKAPGQYEIPGADIPSAANSLFSVEGQKNVIDVNGPEFPADWIYEESEDSRLTDAGSRAVYASQLAEGLRNDFRRDGITDNMIRTIGSNLEKSVKGLQDLNPSLLYELAKNWETGVAGLDEMQEYRLKNAIYNYLGLANSDAQDNWYDELAKVANYYNDNINSKNKFDRKVFDVKTGKYVWQSDIDNINKANAQNAQYGFDYANANQNQYSNGGRINTSNRFANGGRMSRKESEATRGNARLVRKREEDDDDAYFQDTQRVGSDIDTLAVRVMRGELGTGEQLRRNLGTKYQAVQRRVKQLRASQGGMMGDDVDEFADDELSENAFANGGRLSRITRPNDKRYEIYF